MKKSAVRALRYSVAPVILLAALAMGAAAQGGYHLLKKIPLPGDGGWDYVAADSAARRVYISHDTEIVVLDMDLGKVVGRIAGGPEMHGAAFAPEFGRGFISVTNPGSVVIFDLKTLAKIGEVRVGDDPNGIIYDPYTKRVFSADRGSKRITAIEAKTGTIAGTIENLGGRTEHLASDEAGHVFLNMQDRNTTLKLDARNLKLLETWPLPCEAPSSMDMDRAHGRIFIGCRGSGMLTVLDATTGKAVYTHPMGGGVDAVEFDPQTGLIYAATGADGALWIFKEKSADEYELVQTAPHPTGRPHAGSRPKNGQRLHRGSGARPATLPNTGKSAPQAAGDSRHLHRPRFREVVLQNQRKRTPTQPSAGISPARCGAK